MASRGGKKGKLALEIIFDYSKSYLMATSNDSLGPQLCLSVTNYSSKNRSPPVTKPSYNFFLGLFNSSHRTYLGKTFLVLREQHGPACPRRADPAHLHEAGGIQIPVLLLRPHPAGEA